jgi:hypothetical protein
MRQRPIELTFLHFGFSSSSELENSSLEKSKSLKEVYAQDMIFWNLCKVWNFLASRVISTSGMLSYCSSEATVKEDKANSKSDETVVLVGLALWPPTRALVIRALLVREAS